MVMQRGLCTAIAVIVTAAHKAKKQDALETDVEEMQRDAGSKVSRMEVGCRTVVLSVDGENKVANYWRVKTLMVQFMSVRKGLSWSKK